MANKSEGDSIRLARADGLLENSLGMLFCKIPAGTFSMGSTIQESESPVHPATISKAFFLGKHPVTQRQYLAVMGVNPSDAQGDNAPAPNLLASFEKDHDFFGRPEPTTLPDYMLDLPVENVTWNEAVEFCKKLSEMEGRMCRLPTETEWEYACRAGTRTEFYWGNNMNEDFCHYASLFQIRSGRKGENPWGLCDMLGNVGEWCQDNFAPYSEKDENTTQDTGTGRNKVYRGGSYDFDIALNCRCASRFSAAQDHRMIDVGFRVVLEQ